MPLVQVGNGKAQGMLTQQSHCALWPEHAVCHFYHGFDARIGMLGLQVHMLALGLSPVLTIWPESDCLLPPSMAQKNQAQASMQSHQHKPASLGERNSDCRVAILNCRNMPLKPFF